MDSSFWQRFKENYPMAPLELKAFFIFSLIATALGFIVEIFLPREMKEAVIPITGWLTFMPYAANLFNTVSQIGRNQKLQGRARTVYYNIYILAAYILIMNMETLTMGSNDYGNPYLKISPYRPIWVSVLPALWIVILSTPKIKEYYDYLERNSSR